MLQTIKYNLSAFKTALFPKPSEENLTFSERIKKRHHIFWSNPKAEIVRNTIMNASDPIEKWQDVVNWQRKLSNKYNSREFAAKYSCKVAALYWKGKDANDINFDDLPAQYVIRPTIGHGSGLVFLMNNGINLMDGKSYHNEEIREILANALMANTDVLFLIEEFLKTEDGEYKIPNDFKFYLFNGHIAGIQVINRISSSKGSNSWYNENWNVIANITSNYEQGEVQKAPKCLTEMIKHAKKLSKAYKIFARIDFYATDKGAVFGEFTPTPAKGQGFTEEGNRLLSEYWDKYCNGLI